MGISRENRVGFHELCVMYELDYETLLEMARRAGVPSTTLDAMFIGEPVRRSHAAKMLDAFSTQTGRSCTLTNVKVPLLPTFADLSKRHTLDLSTLSTSSGVPLVVINEMLQGEPVTMKEARLVLQMVSRMTGESYTPDTVDVETLEAQHG
jgi:hypothetical protein